jgi:DNA-binding SARP family transcriptional activator
MEQILESEELTPLSRGLTYLERLKYFLVTGDTESAKAMAAKARQVCEASGVYYLNSIISSLLIYVYGAENDVDKMGETLFELGKKVSPKHRLDYAHYLHQLSWYNSLKGEYVLAVSQARQSLDLSKQVAVAIPTATCQGELATNLIYLGEYGEAHTLLDAAMELAVQMHGRYLECWIRLTRAYTWLRQGKEATCHKELEHAFRLGMEQGYILPQYVMDRRMLASLCEFSLARNIKPDFARLLIRKWALVPETITIMSDTWPWPVKIHTLGTFSIEIDGQPLTVSGKRRNRAIELLIALIALSGRDVAEQQISDLFWPDVEGDMAQQNLKVTLHRLRKLIGQESVVLSEGRLSLSASRIWVESSAYDRLLSVLEAAPDGDIPALVEKAIDRYGSGFMPSEDASWVLSERERLRGRFLRIIGQATERLCELGQWQKAIDSYHKALKIDPLAERFYIGLMRSHYELRQRADGLVAYRRCREVLSKELQIQPSSRTEAWHERLRNST